MKIYKLKFDVNNYENLEPVVEMDADFYQMFAGRKIGNAWKKIELRRMEPEKGLSLGDAPGFVIPVFNEKSLKSLEYLFADGVEVLPFEFEGGILYGINVIKVLDCIDYEHSLYKTFSDGKRIMMFKKYSFDVNKLRGGRHF